MGITQQSAAARLIQPGVCTSTTRPASPFEGQAIFETDTDRMLIWNGTAWVIPNQTTTNPEGLELITSTTFPSGTTTYLDVGPMNSTYDSYRLVVSNVSRSASGTVEDLAITLVTSGGSESTSSYIGSYVLATDASTLSTSYGNRGSHIISSATSASYKHNAIVDLISPAIADYTTILSSGYMSRTGIIGFGFNARHEVATAYSTIRLRPTGGSVSGGSVCLYGYRK